VGGIFSGGKVAGSRTGHAGNMGVYILGKTTTQRRCGMKSGILFTGTGPILILTNYESFSDPNLVTKLATKGIKKFIAYEIPPEQVKEKYGQHYNVVMGDLKQTDDLRILDYDGHHVFYNFSLGELGEPTCHEA
jgi:hypothetical protein